MKLDLCNYYITRCSRKNQDNKAQVEACQNVFQIQEMNIGKYMELENKLS